MKGRGYLHSVKQIKKIVRTEKVSMLGNYRVVSDKLLPGNSQGCIPAAAELGKSRLLIDKGCLLTGQRRA